MKILLAVDGSRHACSAVDFIDRICLPASSEAFVLSIVEEGEPFGAEAGSIAEEERPFYADFGETRQAQAEALAGTEAGRLRERGWKATPMTRHGSAHEEIVAAAHELGVDVVVVGAVGLDARPRSQLGRTAKRVLHRCPCSVLVVRAQAAPTGAGPRDDAPSRPVRILVAFDDSEPANHALEVVKSLELDRSVEVTVMTVLTVASTIFGSDVLERLSHTWERYTSEADQRLGEVVSALREVLPHCSARLLDGGSDPTDEILEAVEQLGVDLLLVGDTGQGRVDRILLGSVSSQLVEHAACGVWVAKVPSI